LYSIFPGVRGCFLLQHFALKALAASTPTEFWEVQTFQILENLLESQALQNLTETMKATQNHGSGIPT